MTAQNERALTSLFERVSNTNSACSKLVDNSWIMDKRAERMLSAFLQSSFVCHLERSHHAIACSRVLRNLILIYDRPENAGEVKLNFD